MTSNWADANTPDSKTPTDQKPDDDQGARVDEGGPANRDDHASTAPPVPSVPTDGSEAA